MWTSIVLLAIVGCSVSAQNPWRVDQEYSYSFYARTLAALPDLKDQYVGLMTKGELLLQARADGKLIGKLTKIAHAHFHDHLIGGLDSEIDEKHLSFQESELTHQQFVLNTRKGVIKSILVNGSITNDEVNQLKAVLSQLQIDLGGENLIKCKHNQLPEGDGNPTALFKSMEPTVTGECETVYDVEFLPGHLVSRTSPRWVPRHLALRREAANERFFQVVKTLNYDNCRVHRGYSFGITAESDVRPHSSKMGDFLSKITVSKIVASGSIDDFTIHQICTTNQIAVSPILYNEQKAKVISQIHMVLDKMQDVKEQLEGPQHPFNVGSLVYQYNLPFNKDNGEKESSDSKSFFESSKDWNIHGENFQPFRGFECAPEIPFEPFSVGYKGRHIQYDNKIGLEGITRRLAKEIGDDLQNPDEIPKRNALEKFDILVYIVRILDLKQIEKIGDELKMENHTLVWKTFIDAIAQAGTPSGVKMICRLIIERQIQGVEATHLIGSLSKHVQIATKDVVKVFFDFIKNDRIKRQKNLYPTALIGFTDFVRKFNYYPDQSLNPVRVEIERYTVREIIPYFGECLQQSIRQNDPQQTLVYIRALGNIGHPDIIGIFEKYIENDETNFTNFQRTAIILSLDKLTWTYPNVVRRILFKVYANVGLTPEIRTTAVHLLMRTNPSLVMLQRMAQYTHEDPSDMVQSAVKSAIQTSSKLKGEKWHKLAKNSKLAEKFLNPKDYGRQYSKIYFKNYISDNLRIMYDQQLNHIIGRDHTYPKIILYKVMQNYGGYSDWNTEIEAMISSVDDLINIIPGSKYTNEQENVDDQQQQGHGQQWSTKYLEKLFNLNYQEKQRNFEGEFFVNLFGHKHFLVFDEKTLNDVPKLIQTIGGYLRNGQEFVFSQLHNRKSLTIAFPLAAGYPFVYTLNTPTLIQAIGRIQGQTKPDVTKSRNWSTLDQIESLNLTAQTKFIYSSQTNSKVGFITPFEHHEYIVGHTSKIHSHIPINFKIDIDIKNRQISGKFAPINGKSSFDLIYASALPFTVRKNILDIEPIIQSKDLKPIQSRQFERFERVIGENTIGMAFKTEVQHQIPADVQIELEKALNQQGILALTSLPYSYQETMKKIWNKQAFSSISLIPYSYEPTNYGPLEKQILLTLATLPIADEFTTNELINLQGVLSLITLPFADIQTLQNTVQHIGVPTLIEQWPINTLDPYKVRIQYDGQRSSNNIIKFGLNFEHAYNLDKDTPISPNRMTPSADELKLLYPIDTMPNSLNRRKQYLENVAYNIRQASSIAFDGFLTFDGEKPAEYIATIAQAESPVNENERIFVFLSSKNSKHSNNSNTKQMCLSYFGKYPNKPALNFEQSLKTDLKANAQLQVSFGESCSSGSSKITANAIFEQSPEYKEELKNSVAGKICTYEMKMGNYQMPACQEAIYRSNILDNIKVSVKIQNPTLEMKNITNRALNTLRYIGFWNFDENFNEIWEPNKLDATIKIAQNLQHLNFDVQAENMLLRGRNLNVLPSLRTFLEYYPDDIQNDVISEAPKIRKIYSNGQQCVIDESQILTFDDKIINEQIGKCWYALVQYFAPKQSLINESRHFHQTHPVSILSRESPIEHGKKELIIAVRQQSGPDHILNLKAKANDIHVTINGKEHKISMDRSIDVYDNSENPKRHQKAAIRLYQLAGQEAKIDIRSGKMQVSFDGVRIRIEVEPTYRGNLRGICGNFNGETVDDLATPKNCILSEEILFIASWALAGQNSCSQEIKDLHRKSQESHCAPIEYSPGNVISQWEAGHRVNPLKSDSNKWSSESSSSSSSSFSDVKSSEENYVNLRTTKSNFRQSTSIQKGSCNVQSQVQFVNMGDKACFTLEELNACPNQCTGENKELIQVPVQCRPTEDAKTQLFIQQVRKGQRPTFQTQRIDRVINFNVPRKCVALH